MKSFPSNKASGLAKGIELYITHGSEALPLPSTWTFARSAPLLPRCAKNVRRFALVTA